MVRPRVLLAAVVLVATAGCAGAPAVPAASPTPSPPAVATPQPSTPGPTPTPTPTVTTAQPTTARPTTAPPTTARPTASATSAPTASCTLPAALLGKDLSSMPTDRMVIALTFDGGANNDGTARILETLTSSGTPATFFLTGQFARSYPDQSRAIAQKYPVGNHSDTHPDFTTLSDADLRAQLSRAHASIEDATGVDARPYFRFPFGARDARTIKRVNAECYVPIRWTVDTLGWKGTSGGMNTETLLGRVFDGAVPGGIVLMHLGSHPTDRSTLDADALPGMIGGLRRRGYTLVTLEEVLPDTP